MSELVALAGVSIHRSPTLPGIEMVVGQPAQRKFPPRLSRTLGICVKSGAGHVVRSNGREELFPANGICVRPPGLVWECGTETNGFVSLDIPEEMLGDVTLTSRMAYGEARAARGFLRLAERLQGSDSRLGGEEVLAQLLAVLAAGEVLQPADCGTAAGSLRRARDFIAQHATRQPRLEQIAAAAGISKFALIRRFRSELGITPHAYQILHQIDHGRERIAAGQSIAAAAQDAGFCDQAHLSRWFRRVHGITPGQYARQTARTRVQFPARLALA